MVYFVCKGPQKSRMSGKTLEGLFSKKDPGRKSGLPWQQVVPQKKIVLVPMIQHKYLGKVTDP